MEEPLINNHTLINFPSDHATNSPLTTSINYSDDVELISLRSMSYTSLKDVISSSPPSVASPTSNSWQEIPIRDPLVQHAAWAYLQPILVEERDEDGPWWRRIEKSCCRLLGCFNDVVMVFTGGWFDEERNECDDKVD